MADIQRWCMDHYGDPYETDVGDYVIFADHDRVVRDMVATHERAVAAACERGKAEALAWRPIETAPRDGREVLLLSSSGRRVALPWGGGYAWSDTYTHWQPLPPPPAGESEKT